MLVVSLPSINTNKLIISNHNNRPLSKTHLRNTQPTGPQSWSPDDANMTILIYVTVLLTSTEAALTASSALGAEAEEDAPQPIVYKK